MAIQTAGQKTARTTKIKIENQAGIELPAYTEQHINKALGFLPIEHLRGLEKVKLVDFINDPRLRNLNVPMKGDLPGLYHPKAGNQQAWLEMSMGAAGALVVAAIYMWLCGRNARMHSNALVSDASRKGFPEVHR
jgi:hypothetical protein